MHCGWIPLLLLHSRKPTVKHIFRFTLYIWVSVNPLKIPHGLWNCYIPASFSSSQDTAAWLFILLWRMPLHYNKLWEKWNSSESFNKFTSFHSTINPFLFSFRDQPFSFACTILNSSIKSVSSSSSSMAPLSHQYTAQMSNFIYPRIGKIKYLKKKKTKLDRLICCPLKMNVEIILSGWQRTKMKRL